jgi:linoleoyl-CoA desaturase
MGGLDYQIEHHLAPKLPHTTLRLAAPRLEAECAARDIRYRVHPSIVSALRAHGRWLRVMGRRPVGA